MSLKNDTKDFARYISDNGFKNPYEAISNITKNSRKLQDSVECPVSEADSISWALRGEEPESVDRYRQLRRQAELIEKKSGPLDDLNYVDDKLIIKSVELSLELSKISGKISFTYMPECTRAQKARVRVLTRMILENIRQGGRL